MADCILKEASLHDYVRSSLANEALDFVAVSMISHWHAVGVDAAVYDLSRRANRRLSGIVVIEAHPVRGFVIAPDDFICTEFANIIFLRLDSRHSGLVAKASPVLSALPIIVPRRRKDRIELPIISPLMPSVGILRIFRCKDLERYRPVLTVIDEGAGAYMSLRYSQLQWKLDWAGSHNGVISRRIGEMTRLAHRLLVGIVRKALGQQSYLLFKVVNGRLVPNESIVALYREVIDQRAGKDESNLRPLAMVLTQPFHEYGQVALAHEQWLIRNVVATMAKKSWGVVLKPHPREEAHKYDGILAEFEGKGLSLARQSVPVEVLFSSLKPDLVIGYTSTALIMANVMYGIPAAGITDMLMDRTDSEYLRVMGSDFRRLAEDIVVGLKDIAQFETFLDLAYTRTDSQVRGN